MIGMARALHPGAHITGAPGAFEGGTAPPHPNGSHQQEQHGSQAATGQVQQVQMLSIQVH